MTPDELREKITEAGHWEVMVGGAPLRIWFNLATREGNCGSLLSGMAYLYDPDIEVVGEYGPDFVDAAVKGGVIAWIRPLPFPPPHPPLPPQKRYWPIIELEDPNGDVVFYECIDCGAVVTCVTHDKHHVHDEFHRRIRNAH